MHDAVKVLMEDWEKLPPADHEFAKSLITQAKGRGLTSKQTYWANKLADAILDTAPKPVVVGDFATVIKLFELAGKKLKHPKIVLQFTDDFGKKVVALTLAGWQSKKPGTVNVTDGRPFGKNTWYGRVTPEGVWVPATNIPDTTMTSLRSLLTAFAENPAAVAADHGKLTGLCCFCNSVLTDDRSTALGYGPTCAKRWNVPWGKK